MSDFFSLSFLFENLEIFFKSSWSFAPLNLNDRWWLDRRKQKYKIVFMIDFSFMLGIITNTLNKRTFLLFNNNKKFIKITSTIVENKKIIFRECACSHFIKKNLTELLLPTAINASITHEIKLFLNLFVSLTFLIQTNHQQPARSFLITSNASFLKIVF